MKENPVFYIIDMGAEQLPTRAHEEDAGLDIYAPDDFIVQPQTRVDVKLGFGTVLPKGYAAYIKPRGSMGLLGLYPIDNPIDSNYRGEIHAIMWNLSRESIVIEKGQRFCQLVCMPTVIGDWPIINPEDAPESDRGSQGYGSTGR